jgi:hypothetical protein
MQDSIVCHDILARERRCQEGNLERHYRYVLASIMGSAYSTLLRSGQKKNELLRAYGGSRGVDLVSRLEKGLVSFNAGLSGQGAPRYMY